MLDEVMVSWMAQQWVDATEPMFWCPVCGQALAACDASQCAEGRRRGIAALMAEKAERDWRERYLISELQDVKIK